MKRTFYAGIALVAVGVVGLVLVLALGPAGPWPFSGGPAVHSLGEEIFLYGTDDGRRIPRRGGIGMMGSGLGCAACHGTDGRGDRVSMMMARFETPDIRWSTLSSAEMEHEEGEAPHPPYDRESFARALRQGVDPGGDRLESPMPRWRISDDEVDALIAYLKQL